MSDWSLSRRRILQSAGAAALAAALPPRAATAAAPTFARMPSEGPGTPRICLGGVPATDAAAMRRVKQIGVNSVLTGGPRIPWDEADIRGRMAQFTAGGLALCNMMISGFDDVIHAGQKSDEQTDLVIQSIRAAGRAGLPVVEYNFYAHRLIEGYKEEEGRAGAGLTAYDYELSRSLPPREGIGTHTRAEQLKRARRFLQAIVPEAEKANVRLALHPNDPPVPLSRGSEQLMASFAHWKEYLDLVKSPFNGMTFDCGVSREMGEDPVEVCRYLGKRDCINHVHFRNVIVRKAYVDYTEVFLDEGQVDMFGVMRELVRQRYPRGLYPEHPRAIDPDRQAGPIRNQYPGGGGFAGEIYNVGYARAMLQAALTL